MLRSLTTGELAMGRFLRSLVIALSALLLPSAAHAVPLTFRIDFSSGEAPTFVIDSSVYESASITVRSVEFSSPFGFGGALAAGLYPYLPISFLFVEAGQGTIDLNGPAIDAANPFVPFSNFEQVCVPLSGCIPVLSGGRIFNAGDGIYEDIVRYDVAGVTGTAIDRGTYAITLVGEVPLPATLPLLTAALGVCGFLAYRRQHKGLD